LTAIVDDDSLLEIVGQVMRKPPHSPHRKSDRPSHILDSHQLVIDHMNCDSFFGVYEFGRGGPSIEIESVHF